MEIPPLPETKLGLKYHVAAEELRLISDDFFAIRNHNQQYKSLIADIKSEIKSYGGELSDNQELEKHLLKKSANLTEELNGDIPAISRV